MSAARGSAPAVRRGAVALLALACAGCMVGPDYQRPVIELPHAYADAPPANTVAPTVAPQWWSLYRDPDLDNLVAAAMAANTDLRIATARVDEAESIARQVDAAIFPEIDLGAAGSRTRSNPALLTPGSQPLANNFRVALSTSFEIDFWGRLRRAAEAARAQALGSHYARDVVALTLAGDVAQTYFALRSFDAQIAATRETLQSREQSAALVNRRARGGVASDLDVAQAEGLRAQAAAQLKLLVRQRAAALHMLGTLTGRLDLAIAEAGIDAIPLPPQPPPGLPSALIEQRPDVRKAEQDLVSANAQIGVAKAALLPTIDLTGDLGAQSASLASLLQYGSRIWSIGFGLAQPIFDAGRRQAAVEGQEAFERETLAAYQKSLETAFREVADALVDMQQTTAAAADYDANLVAARNALRLATRRYEAGLAQFLDVLDAQRTVNTAELARILNRQAQLAASVDLMKALGGGWTARDGMAAR
ncbi:MAG TPA: efflux transporter outer membrane subunit [Casimicrobiaceae bacterium]|jgi:multidrug efflux system outer membrane protein